MLPEQVEWVKEKLSNIELYHYFTLKQLSIENDKLTGTTIIK